MHKMLTTLLVLSLSLAAGCGGDDDSSGSSASSSKPEKAATTAKAAAPAGVPTYSEVKGLALDDPKVAKLCGKGTEDRRIGIPAAGEQYTRLFCGDREVLDYVAGKKGFADNYKAAIRYSLYPVWSEGSEVYVKAGLNGPKKLADQVKQSCGCGKVTPGGYGR